MRREASARVPVRASRDVHPTDGIPAHDLRQRWNSGRTHQGFHGGPPPPRVFWQEVCRLWDQSLEVEGMERVALGVGEWALALHQP